MLVWRPAHFWVLHSAAGWQPPKTLPARDGPHRQSTSIIQLRIGFSSTRAAILVQYGTWRRRRPKRLSLYRYQYGFGTSTRRHPLGTFSSTSKRCVVMHLPLILTYSLSTDPISGCKFQIFHLHSGISQRTLRFRTQGGLPCSRTRVEYISTLISWSPNHSCQCTICSRPLTWLAIQSLRSTVFRNLPKSARRVARSRPTLLPHGRTRRSFGMLGISSGRRCNACAEAA